MYTIYGLIDPRTNQIRYVGQTSQHVTVRLQRHLDGRGENPEKLDWIAELKGLNLKPTTVILEYVDLYESALDAEVIWIRRGLLLRWPLLNSPSTTPMHNSKARRMRIAVAATADDRNATPPQPPSQTAQGDNRAIDVVLWWVERLYNEDGALHPTTRRVLLEMPWSARSKLLPQEHKERVKTFLLGMDPPLFIPVIGNGLALPCRSKRLALTRVREVLA